MRNLDKKFNFYQFFIFVGCSDSGDIKKIENLHQQPDYRIVQKIPRFTPTIVYLPKLWGVKLIGY